MDYDAINKHARELIAKFDVRTVNELVTAGSLSGGNQQKAIIARELDRHDDFIIANTGIWHAVCGCMWVVFQLHPVQVYYRIHVSHPKMSKRPHLTTLHFVRISPTIVYKSNKLVWSETLILHS